MPDPTQPNDNKPIGDPASLFDTDEIRPIKVPPISTPAATSPVDGYDLEGYSAPSGDIPVRPRELPTPVAQPKTRSQPKPKLDLGPSEPAGKEEYEAEASEVDPIWTRAAEWGPDLIRVGAVGFGTLFLVWLSFGYTIGWLFLLAGGAATVLLSYPLAITIERPVRITPEQAVNDFYAAASHHFPHYRRMWLLLSVLGRESGRFRTYEAFREHWKSRIEHWKQVKGVSKWVPLKFEVDSFRADKSTGKETSRADYTVHVHIRDREDEGPIESIKMVHGLVKGPDRMWYLNRGTLVARDR